MTNAFVRKMSSVTTEMRLGLPGATALAQAFATVAHRF